MNNSGPHEAPQSEPTGSGPLEETLTAGAPTAGAAGVGLRPKHYDEIISTWPRIDWFEIISENFLVPGGRPLHILDQVRSHYPVAMHGVSLSIGSVDPLNFDYLARLKDLAARCEPMWISDHLCWTSVGGHNSHDLLPLPYTPEAVGHVAERVSRVQDFLGRRILLENVSTYLEFEHAPMPEWEFLNAVAAQADCEILLDINNIYVSAFNHGFSAREYLGSVAPRRVRQFHLAGHTDRGTFLHDTHDHPVCDDVWSLYDEAVRRFGPSTTLIEWDDQIPPLATLMNEADRARHVATAALSHATDTRTDPSTVLETDHRA
jgi:uncharacterized protein (UPF0276 family)